MSCCCYCSMENGAAINNNIICIPISIGWGIRKEQLQALHRSTIHVMHCNAPFAQPMPMPISSQWARAHIENDKRIWPQQPTNRNHLFANKNSYARGALKCGANSTSKTGMCAGAALGTSILNAIII